MLVRCFRTACTILDIHVVSLQWRLVRILFLISVAEGFFRSISIIDWCLFSWLCFGLIFLLFGLNGLLLEGEHLEELGAATPGASLGWLHCSERRDKSVFLVLMFSGYLAQGSI